jgi:hypothetical protein
MPQGTAAPFRELLASITPASVHLLMFLMKFAEFELFLWMSLFWRLPAASQ